MPCVAQSCWSSGGARTCRANGGSELIFFPTLGNQQAFFFSDGMPTTLNASLLVITLSKVQGYRKLYF